MVKHYFDTEVAAAVGINAAVVFQNISYWILFNAEQGRNLHEGQYWMYSTQAELAEQFEYLTVRQMQTALKKLIDGRYLRTGCFNRHGYDRTTWYGLDAEGERITQKCVKEETEGAKGTVENVATIPYIKKTIINEEYKQRIRALAENCGAVCNL